MRLNDASLILASDEKASDATATRQPELGCFTIPAGGRQVGWITFDDAGTNQIPKTFVFGLDSGFAANAAWSVESATVTGDGTGSSQATAPSPSSTPSVEGRSFALPTGNIVCAFAINRDADIATVVCDVLSLNRSASFNDTGQRLRVHPAGTIASDARTVPYGSSIHRLGFTCTSLKRGMRCVLDATRRGFLASRSGFAKVEGGDATRSTRVASAANGFTSPGGNIACHWYLSQRIVVCAVISAGKYGVVTSSGTNCIERAHHQYLFKAGPKLAYGASQTRFGIRCRSRARGIECANTRTGHGFLLSRGVQVRT